MKICIINNLYPPYVRGGAEQVVVKTVEGLRRVGHQVVVITTAPGGAYKETHGALTIYRFRPWNLFFYTNAHHHGLATRFFWHLIDLAHIGAMHRVKGILLSERPDIVHTHNLMGMSFLIPRLIRRLGMHHIHTVHDVQLVEPSGIIRKSHERSWRYTGVHIRAYSAVMRWLMGSPHVVISPSQFLLDFYASRGFFPASHGVVLRNPLTIEVSRIEKQSQPQVHFLYLGQIEEHKGIIFLVQTFIQFLEQGGKGILHIAGAGSQVEEIKRLVGGREEIIFHGKVGREALPQLFALADVTIVPSLGYENSPTVIFESFAFGVPVLASNVEGIAELIQESENGMTFATENRTSLLEQLAWCAGHRDFLAEMGRKIQARSVSLPEDVYIRELLKFYMR